MDPKFSKQDTDGAEKSKGRYLGACVVPDERAIVENLAVLLEEFVP